jgi:hypothetical protein
MECGGARLTETSFLTAMMFGKPLMPHCGGICERFRLRRRRLVSRPGRQMATANDASGNGARNSCKMVRPPVGGRRWARAMQRRRESVARSRRDGAGRTGKNVWRAPFFRENWCAMVRGPWMTWNRRAWMAVTPPERPLFPALRRQSQAAPARACGPRRNASRGLTSRTDRRGVRRCFSALSAGGG